jgi:hypothetical protein
MRVTLNDKMMEALLEQRMPLRPTQTGCQEDAEWALRCRRLD